MKKRTIILSSLLAIILSGCLQTGGFKKTKSGLLYKIISDQKNPVAKKGEFLKVHFTQKIRDSILTTSYNSMPSYAPVDSVGPNYTLAEIFPLLRKGDSAVVVLLGDSLFKKSGELPPYMKRKDNMTFTFRVLDVFPSEEMVMKDQEAQANAQKEKEINAIQQYLNQNNIKAQRTAKGTFVEIQNPGNGAACDSGKMVSVNYKGQTFSGKVFDTNIDTSFGHKEPYPLVIGTRGAIEGWDDGLRLFKEGGKGRLYVPSMLAYGGNPPQGAPFKAFENLIFDIEIVDVKDPPKGGTPPAGHDPRQR